MTVKYHGRRKPYTEIGIKRVACVRCGKASFRQWQICANNRLYLTVCIDCDVELNRIALEFARLPNAEELLENYRKQQNARTNAKTETRNQQK